MSPVFAYSWIFSASLVHHLFLISQSLCWRSWHMKRNIVFFTGQAGWAKWAWWVVLFLTSSSWISMLLASNQSLFFLEENRRTSTDVCRMPVLSFSKSVSREESSEMLASSSLDSGCCLEVSFHFIWFKTANLELFTEGPSFSWLECKVKLEFAVNKVMVSMTFCTSYHSCEQDVF